MSELTDRGLQEHARQINEAVAALIELEAMKAENEIRAARNESPAHGDDSFMSLQSAYGFHQNAIIEKFRNFY